MNLKNRVIECVRSLPDEVMDCEGCVSDDCMQIRRSSLNQTFYADDVMLKCEFCYATRTHGIAFDNPGEFEEEFEARDGRVIDFARDSYDPSETLEALGYTAKAKTVE